MSRTTKTREEWTPEQAEARIAGLGAVLEYFGSSLAFPWVAADPDRRSAVLRAMEEASAMIELTRFNTIGVSRGPIADEDQAQVYAALTFTPAERWLFDNDSRGFAWAMHERTR